MKLSLRQVLDLRLAGCYDNVSLLAAVGGGMMANPALAGIPYARLAGAAISAAGAYRLAGRAASTLRTRVFASEVDIRSHSEGLENDLRKDWNGMLVGYTVDSGKPLVIPWDTWVRHCFIVGKSGVGKTTLGEWLMFQQIVRGGGVLAVDGKIDYDTIRKINAMCAYADRRDALRVVNTDNPLVSNTYNPILSGDADEVAARVMSLIPSAETNPGADHYRQSGNQGLTTTVEAIRSTGNAYSFMDLSILLQSEEAMAYLSSLLPAGSEIGGMYRLFLERFKAHNRDGSGGLDMKKVADLFGGIGGRLFSFGQGNFGKVTSTYTPDVNLFDDIMANRVVYVALPTMGKGEAAAQFGKMTIGDYRTAVSWIQGRMSESERPWPPTLGYFDEAGSYVTEAWSRIFEQSRSAHQVLIPCVQTIANLDNVSEQLREMVLGNTTTKIAFALGTDDTATTIADTIGNEHISTLGITSTTGGGGRSDAGTGAEKEINDTKNMGYSERYEEVYRVPPEDLKRLGEGEAVITTKGNHIYHVKIPRIGFSDEFMAKVGDVEINHPYHPYVKGLNLFERFGKTARGIDK